MRWSVLLCSLAVVALLFLSIPSARAQADDADDDEVPAVKTEIAGDRVGSATDADVAAREDDRIKIDGLSGSEVKVLREQSQKFEFQAEVNRMMKLIINSLYKNKEIFLRELVSNASDALDKIRFLSLTDSSILGEHTDFSIKIKADKENNVLHIIDSGMGMTKEDLQKNLGTIAKSGTAEFVAKIADQPKENAANLIGQFGVGFYSSFLVADTVVVTTKNNADKQYIWESDASSFSIVEDPRGNTLGRGSTVSLYLKPEAKEYLEQAKIEELLHRYSEFITYPIFLWSSKTETVEEPVEEEPAAPAADADAEPKKDGEEDAKVEEETESSETPAAPKTKSVERTVWDYKLINENKPIWTRNPKDVTEEEYNRFYKDFSKDSKDPIAHIHFSAEGEITFRSILYVPAEAQAEHLQNFYKKTKNIKMYVRRVFITDDFEDMLPKYLNFIQGMVDSDDLPLNVSRETLQQNKLTKVIQKKLTRKAIEMLKDLSENETEKFEKIYKEFGTHIKMGCIEDSANKSRLGKLLRFQSSNDKEKQTSLAEYIDRMKDKQEKIFYLAGASREEVEASPFVERLFKKGYEVLYLVDPIDEYLMQSFTEYDGKGFQSVAKEGLTFGDETDAHKDLQKEQEARFQPLLDYLKDTLSEQISKAAISTRLADSPCALVAPSYGISGNMERIMNSQALGQKNSMNSFYKTQKKVLELNPGHPLVKELLSRIDAGTKDDTTKDIALVLYDTAVLRAGFALSDSAQFAGRIERMLRVSMGVDVNAPVEELPEPVIADDEEGDDEEEEEGEGEAETGHDAEDL